MLDTTCKQKTSLKITQENIKLHIKGRLNQRRTMKALLGGWDRNGSTDDYIVADDDDDVSSGGRLQEDRVVWCQQKSIQEDSKLHYLHFENPTHKSN
jgi:hypothetical protein